jgi:HAE1 family hydrophobic/amphiphilic exporter-1
MGYVVIFGMLAASGIAIFLIPVTFYVVTKLSHKGKNVEHSAGDQPIKEGEGHA